MSGHLTHGESLVDRILALRTKWVEVAPGKAVCLVRPAEVQVANRFVNPGVVAGQFTLHVGLAEVQEFVKDWRGITEADIAGSEGATDIEPKFTSSLWAVVVEDRADWMKAVAQGLLELIVEHQRTRAEATKN